MINIEEELFSIVSAKVRESYPDIYMVGEYVRKPNSFPCVTFVEMDNSVYEQSRSTDNTENHVVIMYEVNVYSNKTNGKKAECKEIVSVIDEILIYLGFTRTMLNPTPNMEDATIYRITGRYTAIVDKNYTIYRR